MSSPHASEGLLRCPTSLVLRREGWCFSRLLHLTWHTASDCLSPPWPTVEHKTAEKEPSQQSRGGDQQEAPPVISNNEAPSTSYAWQLFHLDMRTEASHSACRSPCSTHDSASSSRFTEQVVGHMSMLTRRDDPSTNPLATSPSFDKVAALLSLRSSRGGSAPRARCLPTSERRGPSLGSAIDQDESESRPAQTHLEPVCGYQTSCCRRSRSNALPSQPACH